MTLATDLTANGMRVVWANLIYNGITSAVSTAAVLNANVQSGSYMIQASDVAGGGGLIVCTGSLQTITLPSVSGFQTYLPITVVNSSSTRCQILSGFPSDVRTLLYPNQSVTVAVINGSWQSLVKPGRWVVPSAPTLYVNSGSAVNGFGAGSDSNDGLDIGSPVQHIQTAIARVQGDMDFGGGVLKIPTIQLAYNTTGSPVTYSEGLTVFGPLVGGEDFTIIGNASSPDTCVLAAPANNYGLQTRDQGIVTLNGFKITTQTAGYYCLYSSQWGTIDVHNIDFAPVSTGGAMLVTDNGTLNVEDPITLSTSMAAAFGVTNSGSNLVLGANVSIPNAITISGNFISMSQASNMVINGGVSFSNPGNVTGTSYNVSYNSVLFRNSVSVPGSAGSTSNGGQVQ